MPRPALEPQGETAGMYRAAQQRPVPPVLLTLLRVPGPRLTAIGSGLLATALMVATGGLVQWLLGTAPVLFGVVFLLVSVCCALWVRPADAIAAPIAAPLTFAAGMVAVGEGTGGVTGHLMGAATQLALEAPWLYGGTLLAAVIALLRHFALLAVRRQPGGQPAGQPGGQSAAQPAGSPGAPATPPRAPEPPPLPEDRGGAPWEGRT